MCVGVGGEIGRDALADTSAGAAASFVARKGARVEMSFVVVVALSCWGVVFFVTMSAYWPFLISFTRRPSAGPTSK